MTQTDIAKTVRKVPASTWLQDEYIVYSNYVIKHRALMDSDGLKPVHRRILWTMFTQGWLHNKPHVKAIKVVGAVLGSFHPHGDAAVGDALARMAQNFALRVPLIDNYGSVGLVTGDQAAQPRYWEARLTREALELIKEVKDGAVEIGVNFDGKEPEAHKLPARWPVGIINGTSGIAVGYASQIPSHNPGEVMDALVAMIENENIGVDEIMKIMPGPDLPTAGEVFGVDGIKDYYLTGSGRFLMRARYKIEQLPRGRSKIVIYELPYGVSDTSIREKINQLRTPQEKKMPRGRKKVVIGSQKLKDGISKVQRLSSLEHGLRLVIETTQGTDPHSIVSELMDKTNMQTYFSVNSTVVRDGKPLKLGIIDLMRNFIKDRRQCVINKAQFRLEKIDTRLEQLGAMLAALLDIDKCVSIIRNSDTVEQARESLQQAFSINEKQAEYLLSMQLRRLTRADALSLQQEHEDLSSEKNELEELLGSKELIDEQVKAEIYETKKVIDSPRRTVVRSLTEEEVKQQDKDLKAHLRESSKNLPCYVSRFASGALLRTAEPFSYTLPAPSLKYGPLIEQVKMRTQEDMVVVLSSGIGYKIPVRHLMPGKPADKKMLGLGEHSGHIVGLSKFEAMKSDIGLAMATSSGGVKISNTDYPLSKDSFPVATLEEGEEIVQCRWVGSSLYRTLFAMVSQLGKILVFDASVIKPTGSKAKPIKGMSLPDGSDRIIDFSWCDLGASVLTMSNLGIKQTPVREIPRKGRGGQGVATQTLRAQETHLTRAFVGPNPVVCADNDNMNTIVLPPMSKRTARSVDLPFSVLLGSAGVSDEQK